MKKLPKISHLQFLVLRIIGTKQKFGWDVRHELAAQGVRRSGPGFYQLMSRLEASGFVVGEYDAVIVDRQLIRQRRYKLTGTGITEWQNTRDFYFSNCTGVDIQPGILV